MENIFISTAIPYVNARPHIGFGLEIVQADALARYFRARDSEVYFLTGSDENSLKNVRAAQERGMTTRELVDSNVVAFQELRDVLSVSYDDFIRTTEPRHIAGAQKFWRACKDDIYKKTYRGLYCVGCEVFYKQSELVEGLCPEHKTPPEEVEEENYFFRLSAYQERLEKLYTSGRIRIVPEYRANEVLAFIREGLEDFSISRSEERAHGWGISVPDDPDQIMYVWFDALTNYITAPGYADESKNYKKFWDNDTARRIHTIGKGVIRFHAIYWPAMLLAAGVRLPDTIFVHGYITVEGEKMSKSLGNIIDPEALAKEWGTDPLRYFLLRESSPFEDGDFSQTRLLERYNADLANGLGNLFSRSLTLMARQPSITVHENELRDAGNAAEKAYHAAMNELRFNAALEAVWGLIAEADRYVNDQKPWSISDAARLNIILSSLWKTLAHIAELLTPFMPETAQKMASLLHLEKSGDNMFEVSIEKPAPLFQKK